MTKSQKGLLRVRSWAFGFILDLGFYVPHNLLQIRSYLINSSGSSNLKSAKGGFASESNPAS